MGWKAYQAYKPSGVEWLVEIPEHWEIHKLKHVSSVWFSNVDKHNVEGEEPVRLCNYVDVYYNEYITESLEFMAATATHSEIAKFRLQQSDVLITKDSESWNDIAVPAYVSTDLDGVLCGYHLAQIRPHPRKVHGKYLFRAFRTHGINDQFRVAATGVTRFGLGKYWLDNGVFPVPPIDEQRAIAAFLDRETARIDRLIEKKERQIELLQEKRTALISHAVTKGLNPDARMRPSGIEWLGEIPEHWIIKRIKQVVLIRGGQVDPQSNKYLRMRLIAPNHIESRTGRLLGMETAEEQGASSGKYFFQKGDVLYSKIRPELVKVCIAPEDGLCSADMYALIPRSGDVAEYVLYLLLSDAFTKLAVDESIRVAMPKINREDLGEVRFPLPPVSEQKRIVEYLSVQIEPSDLLLARIKTSIEKLREYRMALISAAVTGKIDVSGEAV